MVRKPVPTDTQKTVLLRSRRRCCICYGLYRDTTIKPGQIAHLDKNNSNNKEENLFFLCFEHHDAFDSRTSQSKGFLAEEVTHFRDELYQAVDKFLQIEVHFGEFVICPFSPQNEMKESEACASGRSRFSATRK